ncbi:PREDICTED: UBP1-associated protein 2B-like isoform X2 [Ipomoea nil]|uniref:UBP1-associated protein 2B-like isoform X2 n=1 Tax=Ipomoea nil TaxID=35883 RepID=UPI000901550C|nr:PREDICTED: UBP1-associated protein 2B-like isoform X2 [Ipomoea nil]
MVKKPRTRTLFRLSLLPSSMAKKRKLVKKSDASKSHKKKIKKINNNTNPNLAPPQEDPTPDSESSPENIDSLLEPYSKDQLIALAIDAALHHPSLLSLIRSSAHSDISHRKIFVYGLGYDVTRHILLSAFQPYGEIVDCNAVTDRLTGNCKGYGFVIFKNRKGAVKALKEPRKKIGNRFASCQLASTGPTAPVAGSVQQDLGSRKIYVSNVPQDVDAKRLRDFFGKFGEIECGPLGIDPNTGKWKGYALFVYKTAEVAKKCLEEPYKMFEGRQLHCEKAAEGKSGGKFGGGAAGITTGVVQQPFQPLQAGPEVLNAIAAVQNLAMLGPNPSAALLNPFYSGFLGNPNLGMLNPVLGMGQVSGPGMAAAGYGTLIGGLGANNLMLGTYGSGESSGGMPRGLMHAYPNLLAGQTSASAKAPGNSGYSSQL